MAVNENDYVGFGLSPTTGRRHEIKHLPVVAEWEPGVYQFEEGDKIIGGVDGLDNLPLQQLANRTEYLKQQMESGAASVLTFSVTIPATGWINDAADTTGYPWHVDIPNAAITVDMTPSLTIPRSSLAVADSAGICSVTETLTGALRVYSRTVPTADIPASLVLSGAASASSEPSGDSPEDASDEEIDGIPIF